MFVTIYRKFQKNNLMFNYVLIIKPYNADSDHKDSVDKSDHIWYRPDSRVNKPDTS